MNMRIQVGRQTVKAMQRRLRKVHRRDDIRLVRRIEALLAHLVAGVSAVQLSGHWGFTPACLYQWVLEFVLHGLDSLIYQPAGDRRAPAEPDSKGKAHLLQPGAAASGDRANDIRANKANVSQKSGRMKDVATTGLMALRQGLLLIDSEAP